MFNRSLFKQSCKANRVMWIIITVAVCFTLACVMLIAGDGNLSTTKVAVQDAIIVDEMTSQMQTRALNYYHMSLAGLEHFDNAFREQMTAFGDTEKGKAAYQAAYLGALQSGKTEEEAKAIAEGTVVTVGFPEAYATSVISVSEYAKQVAAEKGYAENSQEALEVYGVIMSVLNPMTEPDHYLFDEFYANHGEEAPRYDMKLLMSVSEEARRLYRQEYASTQCAIFLAGNATMEENVDMILNELSGFGVTLDKYKEFGFDQYDKIKTIGTEALVNFRANYAYRMQNMVEGETEEMIVDELTADATRSLLATLPTEVSSALSEIGQADLYGTLVGSIFFKMAGLLLPIIFLIMASNSLIAGQVDSGSMAYILSSSIKRRTVTFTQAVYLVVSLFLMFCCTTITGVVCLSFIEVDSALTMSKMVLINLGAFLVLFAMSGICFLASCWFNRGKRAMAIGGGLTMFFLVATMLGLFGSSVLPSILRMDTLNMFNYVSIISLFDVVSILEGNLIYIGKLAILVAIGVVCYAVGSEKFARKDLPL